MSEKLKQCPFCKGEFAFDFEAKNFRCGTCGATVLPDPYARTVNTRPIEDDLRKRIAELEEQVWNLNLENERMEEAYWIDESIAPDGTSKPSVRKLLERLEKADTDLNLSGDLIKALDNRIAELTECVGSKMADVYTLKSRIAELEAERRWIPVSERLPDTKIVYDKFDVIVEFENIENGGMTRRVELMSYDYRNKSWNDDCGEYGFYPVAGVTHWRERPTLPEVYGKECEE